LSGDGGDELACGYDRYLWMRTIWRVVCALPVGVRRVFASALREHGVGLLARLFGSGRMSANLATGKISARLTKLAEALSSSAPHVIYRQLISHWTNPEELVFGVTRPLRDVTASISSTHMDELVESLM